VHKLFHIVAGEAI